MSEDIKMADVFCLPLTNDAGFVQEVDGRFIADLDSNEMDEAVVHAVNSHDKLTSRVAELEKLGSDMADELEANYNNQRTRIMFMKWNKTLSE